MTTWLCIVAAALPLAAQSLDFEFYRTRVEPVFLQKRAGHTRCVVCHSSNLRAFNLQTPVPGSSGYTEEQSRRNFENVSRLVSPGNPEASVLLLHPLAHDAGGDVFHSGGRQFRSKDDPEWKTLAEWVRQAKPTR